MGRVKQPGLRGWSQAFSGMKRIAPAAHYPYVNVDGFGEFAR
jgi:hypothetical protein